MRIQRAEVRALRDIVWPTEEPWATQARRHAEQLSAYVCPLAHAVANANALIARSRRTRKKAYDAILNEAGMVQGGVC